MEDLLAALSPEEVSHLVDEMAADPDDKHMPASARSVLGVFKSQSIIIECAIICGN